MRHAYPSARCFGHTNDAGLGRLSRALAGTRGQALILNTPGSTKGAIETLDAVLDIVPHAIELLAGERPH